ncbi:MAG: hypothetical protein AAGC55_06205, partial [Myxococcota bacterium]
IDTALWTRHAGKRVITERGRIRLEALRKTAMWRQFEQIIGRPLCLAGSKGRCARRSTRRDLCAARALPIARPTRDLRHLVAIGPDTFNFYPRLADPKRRLVPIVATREYLQFLRGSGLHPLGSLLQTSDAFNRVIYSSRPERAEPAGSGDDPGYALAASWFPVAPSGAAPTWDCSSGGGDSMVARGLCGVLARGGTAADILGGLLADQRFVIYGAKTGTIDSLADIAESRDACEHFRTGHTIADRPPRRDAQPYWLPCGKNRKALVAVNDSLLIISFAVRAGDQLIPLTLGLRFQRSGPGFAAIVARHYLDTIHDYFAPPAAPAPAPAPAGGDSDSDRDGNSDGDRTGGQRAGEAASRSDSELSQGSTGLGLDLQ